MTINETREPFHQPLQPGSTFDRPSIGQSINQSLKQLIVPAINQPLRKSTLFPLLQDRLGRRQPGEREVRDPVL